MKTSLAGTIILLVLLASCQTETMDIGMDLGAAVSKKYHGPYTYSGEIEYVKFKLK